MTLLRQLFWPIAGTFAAGLFFGWVLIPIPAPSPSDYSEAADWSPPQLVSTESEQQAARSLADRQPWGRTDDAAAAERGEGNGETADNGETEPDELDDIELRAVNWRFLGTARAGERRVGLFHSEHGDKERLARGERLPGGLVLEEVGPDFALLIVPGTERQRHLRLFDDTSFDDLVIDEQHEDRNEDSDEETDDDSDQDPHEPSQGDNGDED